VAHDLLLWYEVTAYKKLSDYVWATDLAKASSRYAFEKKITVVVGFASHLPHLPFPNATGQDDPVESARPESAFDCRNG
jgi:hypothetical protein